GWQNLEPGRKIQPRQRKCQPAGAGAVRQSVTRRLDGNGGRGIMGRVKERSAWLMKTPRRQRTAFRRMSFSGLALFCCVADLIFQPVIAWSQNTPQSRRDFAPAVGAAAFSFDLKSLDGKPVGLQTFHGKPLVM